MTSKISCAITPIGTSFALFFAMVSTIFESLRTHFGDPFRFLILHKLSLFRANGSSCKESNDIPAVVPSSSIGASVLPVMSCGGVTPAPSFLLAPMTCFSGVRTVECIISALPACVPPWALGLRPPSSEFYTFCRWPDSNFM